jgi:alkylhydroperoxidase/carboxymuconolactone decarboxylase family protein YurZ
VSGRSRAGETKEAREQRIIKSLRDTKGFKMYEEWDWAVGQDPDFLEIYSRWTNSFWSSTYEDGQPFERVLHPKYKELIAIILLANRGFYLSLVAHMKRALLLGASKQEIFEFLEASIIPSGSPTMHLGLRALMELERGESEHGDGSAGIR